MKKNIYSFFFLISSICISCHNDHTNQISMNPNYLNGNKMNPAFLNVVDSFIKTDNQTKHDIRIEVYTNIENLELIQFFIRDVDPKYNLENKTQFILKYKNRTIYLYTSIDKIMTQNTNIKNRSYSQTLRNWYVELKQKDNQVIDKKYFSDKYIIQKLDTSGYNVNKIEPIFR